MVQRTGSFGEQDVCIWCGLQEDKAVLMLIGAMNKV